MSHSSTLKRLIVVWPLLFGIFILCISNGLQGTLLGLRASSEGFPVAITGIIMSMYYAGFLIGCQYIPKMISSVGHIRVFAALASMASTTILLHGLFVNPWLWIPIRLLTGFCFSGLFIIAESWLNKIANKEQRGTIFSAYVSIVYAGLFAGQFLINSAPLTKIDLFIMVSILISIALAPITLTNKRTPGYQKPETVSFRKIMSISPLSMAGVFVSGLCGGTMISLGPVYASASGMPNSETAIFMAVYILGNAVLPIFMGALSDKIDRRKVIKLATIIAIICSTLITVYTHYYILIFLLGGMMTSIYSVSITHMNDQIKKSQIVSVSRSLILFNSLGATIGPIVGGGLLSVVGSQGFFIMFAAYTAILLVIALYRSIVGEKIERKRNFVHLPAQFAPSIFRLKEKPPEKQDGDKTP
ncbi:MAG: MFS transporter [Alphaproteobacteria bacterium]